MKKLALSFCTTQCKINHADLFKQLGQLEKLAIISFSDFFKEIPLTVFDDLENLTSLSLISNNITPEWFSHMPKLKSLGLSLNKINRLSKEMFIHLKNLTSFSINGFQLIQFDDGVFSHLKDLENLDISNNINLRELKPRVFAGLDKLKNRDIRKLNDELQLNVDLFHFLPCLKDVSLDERFVTMQPDLSKKYGSKIKFTFSK